MSGFFGWGVYTNLSFTDTKFVSVILKKGTMALGSTSLPFLPKPPARPPNSTYWSQNRRNILAQKAPPH